MLANKKPVKIPQEIKTVIDKRGYVYCINGYNYNAEKKHTDDSRKAIGKVLETDNTLMYPNKNYIEMFKKDTIEEPSSVDSYLHYGQYLAIKKAADHFGLFTCLEKAFPKLFKKIFALALFAIDAEDSTAQHYDKWGFSNYAGLDSCLSSGNISEIYKEIGLEREKRELFFSLFNEAYTSMNVVKERKIIAFDSTNQNTSSSKENMVKAEIGKPKKDEQLPIINTAFFTDELTGIPIYYESFFGSLLDKSQTPFTVEKVNSLGFKKYFYMMDRGYYSKNTLKSMKKNEFAIMCPEKLKFVKEIFQTYRDEVRLKHVNYIEKENCYGILIKEKNEDGLNNYLFYDPNTAFDEVNFITGNVEKILKQLTSSDLYYSLALAEKYKKYFTLVPIGKGKKRRFTVLKNLETIQEEIDNAGLFVIASNVELTSSEIIQIARKRDAVEKNFRSLKTHLLFDKPDVHNEVTYDGKMFVMFIALNLLMTYKFLIKEYLSSVSSFTVHTSLAVLSKIIIEKRDEYRHLRYALTKQSKEILNKLGYSNIETKLKILSSPDKIS